MNEKMKNRMDLFCILEKVLECSGGFAIDDMTVLTTGIWEK